MAKKMNNSSLPTIGMRLTNIMLKARGKTHRSITIKKGPKQAKLNYMGEG